MGLVRTIAPTIEPVTLDEVKRFIGIDHAYEDDDLEAMIQAARERCEKIAGRALIEQTWRLTLDGWPADGEIRLPRPPLLSVTSIKYTDDDGVEQTWTSADYDVDTDSEPGRITLGYNATWPIVRAEINSIRVLYKAGYGTTAASVPAEIRERLKNYVAYCYRNRDQRDEEFLDSLFVGFHCGTLA